MSAIGITDIAGTSGGTVFSKQGGGNYVRRRVRPGNPKSSAQTIQRANFSQQSQAWRALTDAQRDAWNAAAKSGEYQFTTLLGDKFNGSGSQLYNAVNNAIVAAGGTAVSSPPLKVGLSNLIMDNVLVDTGVPEFTLEYNVAPAADEAVIVFASAPMSPGRSRPVNLKKVKITETADTSTPNIYSAYINLFGAIAVGTRIYVEAKLVNKVTGESRLAGSFSTIAQ